MFSPENQSVELHMLEAAGNYPASRSVTRTERLTEDAINEYNDDIAQGFDFIQAA